MNLAVLNRSVGYCSSWGGTIATGGYCSRREREGREEIMGCSIVEKREFCVEKKKFVERKRGFIN